MVARLDKNDYQRTRFAEASDEQKKAPLQKKKIYKASAYERRKEIRKGETADEKTRRLQRRYLEPRYVSQPRDPNAKSASKCIYCHCKSHNIRTCKQNRADKPTASVKCHTCRIPGHNSLTCLQKEQEIVWKSWKFHGFLKSNSMTQTSETRWRKGLYDLWKERVELASLSKPLAAYTSHFQINMCVRSVLDTLFFPDSMTYYNRFLCTPSTMTVRTPLPPFSTVSNASSAFLKGKRWVTMTLELIIPLATRSTAAG